MGVPSHRPDFHPFDLVPISVTETPTVQAGGRSEAALSRELSDFLLEFSIGVHRHAMYPPGHPSLLPVAENIIARLAEIFSTRRVLAIGVARDQLVIEGVATDQRHPVLRDLARRLHGHQLGAVSFSKGVDVPEVKSLLEVLAKDPERQGRPLGLLPSDQLPFWEHVQLFPLGYDQLETKEGVGTGQEPARASHLWIGLARAALAGAEAAAEAALGDPSVVARSIREHRREAAYDQVIVGYLLQLAEELKAGATEEAEVVRRRLSALIRELDGDTLARLVSMGGSLAQRRKFILDANQSLAVDAVVKILQAAAQASEQTISSSLVRLLGKLSAHAEAGARRVRDQADTALRDHVEELLKDWELRDPNPDQYTLILDAMARAAPLLQGPAAGQPAEELPGAKRLLQMSFEVDVWGPTVAKAVSDLMEAGDVAYLLELVQQAPPGSLAAARVREHLTRPANLRRFLAGPDVDETSLRGIVEPMGTEAIPVLLDALVDSESRSVRRKVFDLLAQMGAPLGPALMARLQDPRWYALRNFLALAQRIPQLPEGFSALPFLDHPDPRVRREAFPLAVAQRGVRDRVLAVGLADPDERMARMALLEVQEHLPETLVPVLVNRILLAPRPSELKVLGVKALATSRSPLVLEALLQICSTGRSWLGKPKLAAPSPEVVEGLALLRDRWREHPRVRPLLAEARRSRDPQLVRVAGSGEGP